MQPSVGPSVRPCAVDRLRPAVLAGVLSLLAVGLLAACGPKSDPPQQCTSGQVVCGSSCVTPSTDPKNCGECGVVCQQPVSGQVTCVGGLCIPSCTAPQALCSAQPNPDGGLPQLACTNTNTDPVNCGVCGHGCLPNQTCVGGTCTGCPNGTLRCAGSTGFVCEAVLSDNANCGACGNVCPANSRCDNGACIVLGQENCGNADGGAATSADLQNDPNNCGACGHACLGTEACRLARCVPCPVARCGNLCADTRTDPTNCGACGTACAAHQACVAGKCGPGVVVTILDPADGGVVPATATTLTDGGPGQPMSMFTQNVRVDSALPVISVYLDTPAVPAHFPDGGLNPSAKMNAQSGNATPSNIPTTYWSLQVQLDGGATLTATAYDELWNPSSTDQADHAGVGQVTVVQEQPFDPNYVAPPITVTAGNSGPLDGGSVVPLGGPNVQLSIPQSPDGGPVPASLGGIDFWASSQSLSSTLLGSGQLTGANYTLQVSPTKLPLGNVQVFACPRDRSGQYPQGCSPSNTASLIVGTYPEGGGDAGINGGNGGSLPVLTADDAGTHTVWYLDDPTNKLPTAPLVNSDFGQVLPNGYPDGGYLGDAGYYADTLVRAERETSVIAVRGTGEVDRFDCPGTACYQANYVKNIAGGARRVRLVTSRALWIDDATGNAWFSDVSGGTATAAGGALVGNAASLGNGAIIGDVRDSGGTHNVVLYHPSVGLQTLGSVKGTDLSGNVTVVGSQSGEFYWYWTSTIASGNVANPVYAGFGLLSGSNLFKVPPATPFGNGSNFSNMLPVRPGVLAGLAYDITSGQPTLVVADVNQGKLNEPLMDYSKASGSMVVSGVQNSVGARNPWGQFPYAVSDDQLKLLCITSDAATAGGPIITYTVWLVDLPTRTAAPIFASTYLAPFALNRYAGTAPGNDNILAPHFVHSAAGAVGTVVGGTPSGSVAAVPVVVVTEELTGNNINFSDARIWAIRYSSGTSVVGPSPIDRLGFVPTTTNPYTNPTYAGLIVDTAAAGGSILFKGQQAGGDQNLYQASLTPDATGHLPSTLLVDQLVDFDLREDTGQLIALRRDGTLLAGALDAPGHIALKGLLTGATGGQPPQGGGQNDGALFGFTPDGNHAWALVEAGAAGIDQSGVIELVDLRAGTHVNYGGLIYAPNQGLRTVGQPFAKPVPLFFLQDGAQLFAFEPRDDFSQYSTQNTCYVNEALWSAGAANGTSHADQSLPLTFSRTGSFTSNCFTFQFAGAIVQTSVDGKEGLLTSINNNIGKALTAPAAAAAVGVNSQIAALLEPDATAYGALTTPLNGASLVASQAATYSPYGAPRTDAWDLIEDGSVGALLFKVWGGYPSAPRKVELLATGAPSFLSVGQTISVDQREVIFAFPVGNQGAVTHARLSGATPPPVPLP